MKKTTLDEVEKYVEERKDTYKGADSFTSYLDDVFKKGDDYYEISKAKGIVTNKES